MRISFAKSLISLFVILVSPSLPAALMCSEIFTKGTSQIVGGANRLRQFMNTDLVTQRKEILHQDLNILKSSNENRFSNTLYLQFVGNKKLNEVIKDSMVPDFISSDLVEVIFKFFERNPQLGVLSHFNYRDIVINTNISKLEFENQLRENLLPLVAKRFSAEALPPNELLSKEWILDHIRIGTGSDTKSAFFNMKIANQNVNEVLDSAHSHHQEAMEVIARYGISPSEMIRFMRYDLQDSQRATAWFKRYSLPSEFREDLLRLKDDFFLYDYLPAPRVNLKALQQVEELFLQNNIEGAIQVLSENGLASWRLQRAQALAKFQMQPRATLMATDQKKLGLANFMSIHHLLQKAEIPQNLDILDIPNSRGLYRHHLWLKKSLEDILDASGSVNFWLIGDDATWILPPMTSLQSKRVTQFLKQSVTLHFSLSTTESFQNQQNRADQLARSRQELVNHKSTIERALGWPVGRDYSLEIQQQQYYLNGHRVQKIEDAWGMANSGIFTYTVDGSHRLLKILRPEYANQLMTSLDSKEVTAPELLLSMLNREFAGGMLGEKLGGPKIHNVGFIRLPDGKNSFFIEMENIFAGRPSKTLKTFIRDAKGDLSKLSTYVRQMAQKIVEAYEIGVIPYDPDFIFSDGSVRWIDTGAWELISGRTHEFLPIAKRSPALQVYERLIGGASTTDIANGFRQEFVNAINISQQLSLQQKADILKSLRNLDPRLLKKVP